MIHFIWYGSCSKLRYLGSNPKFIYHAILHQLWPFLRKKRSVSQLFEVSLLNPHICIFHPLSPISPGYALLCDLFISCAALQAGITWINILILSIMALERWMQVQLKIARDGGGVH